MTDVTTVRAIALTAPLAVPYLRSALSIPGRTCRAVAPDADWSCPLVSATEPDRRSGVPYTAAARSSIVAHAPHFARFAAVGLAGVVVNSVALYLLVGWAGLPAWIGAALSAEVALVHNFAVNSTWTFRRAGGRAGVAGRFLRYNLICGGAIGINVVVVGVLTSVTELHYLLANLLGIGFGLAWNYGMNVSFTWSLAPVRTPPD